MNIQRIHTKLLGRIVKRLYETFAIAAALCALPAHAAITTGDQFTSTFTEISGPEPGLTGTAIFTVGTPANPGFFNVFNFSVTVGNDLCLSCGLLTENLSGLLFDVTTFDMKGSVTGTFQGNEGNGGNLHTFDLALTEFPDSWTLTDVRVSDGRTDISSGTYTPAVSAIPEPSSWIMLSLGVLALAYGKRTRKGRS